MNEISIHLNKIEFEELHQLHRISDHDFDPPLSTRTDIEAYCRKLYERAEAVSVDVDGALAGILCVYANDDVSRTAFISSVLVEKSMRGLGLGDLLVSKAISLAEEKGMVAIGLEVGKENSAALGLYKKHGFAIQKENGLSFIMTREINGN